MSKKYELIKKYYDEKLWSITRVANMVVKGWITEEEYKLITGFTYPNKSQEEEDNSKGSEK